MYKGLLKFCHKRKVHERELGLRNHKNNKIGRIKNQQQRTFIPRNQQQNFYKQNDPFSQKFVQNRDGTESKSSP